MFKCELTPTPSLSFFSLLSVSDSLRLCMSDFPQIANQILLDVRDVGGCPTIKMWRRNYCIGLKCNCIYTCITWPYMWCMCKENFYSDIIRSPNIFNFLLCMKINIQPWNTSECSFIRWFVAFSDVRSNTWFIPPFPYSLKNISQNTVLLSDLIW